MTSEYPSDEDLRRIARWPYADFEGLLDFIESLWNYAEWGFRRRRDFILLSTGGWSGNEEILSALRDNTLCWTFYWVSSRRGGHHVFRLKG